MKTIVRLVILASFSWLFVAPSPPASAVALPGGRPNYVVSLGKVDTVATDNWARLAFYRFDTAGNAYQTFWYYAAGTTPDKANTGLTTSGCTLGDGSCTVWTSRGFEDHTRSPSNPYPKTLTGSYSVSGNTLTVRWPGATETWSISQPKPDLAKLTLIGATGFTASVGTGYGSTASNNSGVSAARIRSQIGTGKTWRGHLAQINLDTRKFVSASTFTARGIQSCNSQCFRWSSPGDYYLIAVSRVNSRKNFHEHHATEFPGCYDGNPHLKPMLQVIGDSGEFHGWVGVQASLFPDGADYLGVFQWLD